MKTLKLIRNFAIVFLIFALLGAIMSCTEIEVQPKSEYAVDPVSSEASKERGITIK